MKLEGFPDMHVPSLKTHAICIQVFMHLHSTLHPTHKKHPKITKKQNSKMFSPYTVFFHCKSEGALNII